MKALGGKAPQEVKQVHVVGAGVMGGDIAAWCALRGLSVTLQDRGPEFVQPALARAQDLFSKRLRDPELVRSATARLRADVPGDGVPEADVVIEAIFENLGALRHARATHEAKRPARDEYLEPDARSTRREARQPGAPRRPALFQSGREDAAR
jgi:3-hydroxyacyl-CoA dehydrogenase/enoyl-CoA hydratase/3-hydroxybutyryl-CoA epimerase